MDDVPIVPTKVTWWRRPLDGCIAFIREDHELLELTQQSILLRTINEPALTNAAVEWATVSGGLGPESEAQRARVDASDRAAAFARREVEVGGLEEYTRWPVIDVCGSSTDLLVAARLGHIAGHQHEPSARHAGDLGTHLTQPPCFKLRGAVCTTNGLSAHIEQWQDAFGEGPCVDAYREDRPVLEPNLAHPITSRWLAFAPPAVEAGVGAVFGFPLQVGAVRLGALNLYCDRPGPLSEEQYADALVMADVAAQALLVLQANAPPGQLAVELEACADFQTVVHQASGMVAAQLGVGVGQALIRLRAYAFGNERPLTQVAEAVVARNLRFDASIGEKDLVL